MSLGVLPCQGFRVFSKISLLAFLLPQAHAALALGSSSPRCGQEWQRTVISFPEQEADHRPPEWF